MRLDINIGPIRVRSDAHRPSVKEVLIAHRAKTVAAPAHKVQLVVPSAPLPSAQSAVIRTLRPTTRRLNASSNLHAAYGRVETGDKRAGSEATRAEGTTTGHTKISKSSHGEHGLGRFFQSLLRVSHGEDRPRDRDFRIADPDDRNSGDTPCEKDGGNTGRTAVRTHRALCAAGFEDSGDEDSLCGDGEIRGLHLEAGTHWSNCNNELESSQDSQLTTMQLQVQENTLREIAHQAIKARRNGRMDSSIFSKGAPEEEDWVLEMILECMELGESMIDAGTFQGEEGRDILSMVRSNFHTLMRKATRPYCPSGIRPVEVELCLEAFIRMRLKLLHENPGMSMAEILEERSLDLRPR